MPIRLIAADLDDTLLDAESRLRERTVEALRAAIRRGVYVVLASGRMPLAMRPFAEAIGVNAPVIAYNGALTVNLSDGSVSGRFPVPEALAREAAAMAEDLGAHVQAFQGDRYCYAQENVYSGRYAASIHWQGEALGRPLSQAFTGEADKLLVIQERENIAVWSERFRERFQGRLRCFISRPNYIEITHTDAAKENALRALCERLGVPLAQAAAFGDGENDLGMVRLAGHGYVMANARENVRAGAPAVAPANTEDGVAQIVEAWLRDGTIGGRNA